VTGQCALRPITLGAFASGATPARPPGPHTAPAYRVLVRSRLAPLFRDADVAWVYAAMVLVVAIVVEAAPGGTTEELVLDSSTNLENLRHTPLLVLGASAFVIAPLPGLWILAPLVATLAAAQRWLGRAATVIVATLGHVGVTLFVAVLLAAGIDDGRLSPALARAQDVGVSYAVATVAGLLVGRVPRRLRPWYAAGLLVFTIVPLLLDADFTEVGHLAAVLLGFALAVLVARGSAGQS
jgi:hypothetical protein